MEPEQETILLKIQKSRKESQRTIRVNMYENLNQIKEMLSDAYYTIR